MTFTQYDGYLYLYILFLFLIPAAILGLSGKNIKHYGMIATAAMIYLLVGVNTHLYLLIGFMIWQVVLILMAKKIFEKLNDRKELKKKVFRLFVFLSLLPLIINKVQPIFQVKLIGFIGISYLSFRTVQIIIEMYDGAIKEIKVSELLYFVLFFPTISSGPIDRSRRFSEDLNKKIGRREYVEDYLVVGIGKIFKGMMYKFVFGALINMYWTSQIVPVKGSIIPIILYMYGYTLYLFFDFGGYSLMAVGTSYIFGIKVMDNFDKPFVSKDIKEFWTRWHISLSRWFGDYIFSRFVLDSLRKKRFKKRATASHIGQLITMGTMGFWHGLTWYYILYGIYHGVLLVLTDMFQKTKIYKKLKGKKIFNAVQIFVTFHLVCIGMLIFSGFLDHYLRLFTRL